MVSGYYPSLLLNSLLWLIKINCHLVVKVIETE